MYTYNSPGQKKKKKDPEICNLQEYTVPKKGPPKRK